MPGAGRRSSATRARPSRRSPRCSSDPSARPARAADGGENRRPPADTPGVEHPSQRQDELLVLNGSLYISRLSSAINAGAMSSQLFTGERGAPVKLPHVVVEAADELADALPECVIVEH